MKNINLEYVVESCSCSEKHGRTYVFSCCFTTVTEIERVVDEWAIGSHSMRDFRQEKLAELHLSHLTSHNLERR